MRRRDSTNRIADSTEVCGGGLPSSPPLSSASASNDLLYETRFHASRPYSPNYPPQQSNDSKGRGLLSLIPTRGFTQLKEKWSKSKLPTKSKKFVSLFVSPTGERVATAVGNRITILRKEDGYRESYGIFTCGAFDTFTYGAWSESHDVLGVADSSDTLYFVKANGEEIVRIEKKHLKVTFPIVGLLVLDDAESSGSVLCNFNFLTSDGSVHQIEISPDHDASLSSILTQTDIKRQFSQGVYGVDYNPDQSLLVLLGCSEIQLWRWTKPSEFQQLTCREFDGLVRPKDNEVLVTFPKVLISHQGNYVAILDLRGCTYVFKLDMYSSSFSALACGERSSSMMTDNRSTTKNRYLDDIIDFTWWSDHVLVLAIKGGSVIMYDVINGRKIGENDSTYCMPALERILKAEGEVFVLNSRLGEESRNCARSLDRCDVNDPELLNEQKNSQIEISSMIWRLISFSEKSVPEMYEVLINSKNYESALHFAVRHKLEKDKVLKSQWLHSGKGVKEINLFLSNIKDEAFVLGECAQQVGPTEDSMKLLLAHGLHMTNHYSGLLSGSDCSGQVREILLVRLKLLQFRDRLETFLGVNMGRFSAQEYSKFRVMPINEVAGKLADSGKIGALNLLFKRHPYSLAPSMLEILSAIPETVPVQTYAQLLPGRSRPSSILLRDKDWVECEKMATYVKSLPVEQEDFSYMRTEHISKLIMEFCWPSIDELSAWYKNRARDIDKFTGQLENSFAIVDFACRKGIYELQKFSEDISYLQQLIYMEGIDDELHVSLTFEKWESLSDYEKFSAMLKGVKGGNVVEKLRGKAIPFMQKRLHDAMPSFLVRWMKDIAIQNNIEICLAVIEEGCKDLHSGIFANELEAIDCALQCLYSCSVTDQWITFASIVTKLPHMQSDQICSEDIERRIKMAEGHIEAGRLLAQYQVPKPMSFFLDAQEDERGVKQILRLMLSKFIRRQPGHSDIEWANLWRDLQCLQEKAFPFLDLEYVLIEFCRGLLKAGKFSLARNYLKGTGSVHFPSEKAENLVIQTAREFFFSASSLSSSEIWKAKECLDLYPNNRSVRAEGDIIDALTVKLPSLGVHLLPMQYKQIKEPMEIIKMAIISHSGAYLNVDELIEVAKLLGLNSEEDISNVQEAIAREAAVAGDLQLAVAFCLALARKGHGLIWDLCAAIARGPAIDNMDMNYRKQLLGFALSHCDDESIGELLHAWKDIDVQGQCESLMMLSGSNPSKFTIQGSSVIPLPGHMTQHFNNRRESSEIYHFAEDDHENQLRKIRNVLAEVARELPVANGNGWDDLLIENGKLLSFAALQLPWLLELSRNSELEQKCNPISIPGKYYASVRTQSVLTILSWLARHGFAPKDDLIASLAKSIMQPPVTEDEDIMGCSFLLNLINDYHGVEIIEEQLRTRKDYQEICSIMNVGMTYSSLYNSEVHIDPIKRRELLFKRFKEKISPDELDKIDKAQAIFWRSWKTRLEEQKQVADRTKALEQLIPGVEIGRFLSGDFDYVRNVVLTFVESVRLEKKHILKDVLKLADTYGLSRSEVLLKFLTSILVSEAWSNYEITAEITELKGEILACAPEMVEALTSMVYAAIDGCNKDRLAYIYGLLSECYLHLQDSSQKESLKYNASASYATPLAHFCKILEQECTRVSFIKDLNFKKIADVGGLNSKHFNQEICDHINEFNVEALADMVKTLISSYTDPAPDLIHWQDVHRYYVLTLLKMLETRAKTDYMHDADSIQCFLSELEQTYDVCKKHIRVLEDSVALDIMKKFFKGVTLVQISGESLPDDLIWKECLVVLLSFWMRLTEDMQECSLEDNCSLDSLGICLKIFLKLFLDGEVSSRQGWCTVYGYACNDLFSRPLAESFYFCEAMILTGCELRATDSVFTEASQSLPEQNYSTDRQELRLLDVSDLYLNILESTLATLVHESSKRPNLRNLLSSLSKFEAYFETLKRVRLVVWDRLSKMSQNLQLASHVRVYILEVMQCILGRNSGGSAEQDPGILAWEGWDEWQSSEKLSVDTDQAVQSHSDAPKSVHITLVALRSTKLASTVSPSSEISAYDLHTVDSAALCFSKLCKDATTKSDFDSLFAILGEWEALFATENVEEPSHEAGVDWSDEWADEGWESFGNTENENKDCTLSVHPLHACWSAIFNKLAALSQHQELFRILDKSMGKPSGSLLINEEEAQTLSNTMLGSDNFVALKFALSLPYEAMQLHCLDALERKLQQGEIPDLEDAIKSNGFELLILLLNSGIVSTIISKQSYGATFSCLSFLIGSLSRACQERLSAQSEEEACLVFRKLLFPSFITELVKLDQQILAGLLVTKFMHTNAALSLINIAEATLKRFLRLQLQALEVEFSGSSETYTDGTLGNCVSCLRGKLKGSILSALSSLPSSK
ncbi:hypothetical protein V2J09_006620 [Rumex salicifolius]